MTRTLRPLLVAILVLLAPLLAGRALALEVPEHGGRWVVDQARLLQPQEAAQIERELSAYAGRTGNQVVVLTVPGLQGEAIPLLSRILAVADFTDRHRRRGETDAQIAAALRECAGHAFDPQCVEVMCGMLTERT